MEDRGWKNTDGVAAGLQPANCGFEQQCRTREALPRTGAAEIGAANRAELEPRPDARRTRHEARRTRNANERTDCSILSRASINSNQFSLTGLGEGGPQECSSARGTSRRCVAP